MGLAGSYDRNGKLKYLAIADNEQVLELRLDARELDTMFAKKKLDPEELNTAMAKTLQDLFVNSERYFLAFDADRLAAALYLGYGIRVKRFLHCQSLKQSLDIGPNSFQAIMTLFLAGGYTISETDRQDLEDAFLESCDEPHYDKRLSFRATSAFYMQRLFGGEIQGADLNRLLKLPLHGSFAGPRLKGDWSY